jgi:hypothetical protein
MIKFIVPILALCLIGCSNKEKIDAAKSQATTIAVTWENGDDSKLNKDHTIDDIDPWGNKYIWIIHKLPWRDARFMIDIRSAGPDGVMYTRDDIIVSRIKQEESKAVRKITKDAVIGIREGLKEKLKE